MDAKEKAKELVDRYYHHLAIDFTLYQAKQCAIICIDEVLKEHCKDSEFKDNIKQEKRITYWQSVKEAINNL